MNPLEFINLMAQYNSWMNHKVYKAARELSDSELTHDRKAFFGSIYDTLNHICVADVIWLRRLSTSDREHPAMQEIEAIPTPSLLNQRMADSFDELTSLRALLDDTILGWCGSLDVEMAQAPVSYSNLRDQKLTWPMYPLLMHMFNHQTHHRGQVSALLSQAGVDVGVTDLVAFMGQTQAATSQAVK